MIRCGQPGSHNLLDFFLSLQQTKPTCSKSIHGSQRAKVPEVGSLQLSSHFVTSMGGDSADVRAPLSDCCSGITGDEAAME